MEVTNQPRDSFLVRNAKRTAAILTAPRQLRHFPRWLKTRQRDYLLDAPLPWLTFDAIDFLTPRVTPGAHVFEWGSGGSTLYWLSRGAEVVSVEHDPAWHARLASRLSAFPGVDYRLVLPEPGDVSAACGNNPADPDCYHSSNRPFARMNFACYVRQIDPFPDGYFDLVVVDGRARPSCLKHALPKVKSGGMLVLDNAERAYYLTYASSMLEAFEEHRFFGAAPTTIWYAETRVYVRRGTQRQA